MCLSHQRSHQHDDKANDFLTQSTLLHSALSHEHRCIRSSFARVRIGASFF